MRNKSFTFSTYSELMKNEALKTAILKEAAIIEEGDGHRLKKGDVYTNSKEDVLYYVLEIERAGQPNQRTKVDPLLYLNPKAKGERAKDFISGNLYQQRIKILDVKRVNQ
jgi:hypothetical protein